MLATNKLYFSDDGLLVLTVIYVPFVCRWWTNWSRSSCFFCIWKTRLPTAM